MQDLIVNFSNTVLPFIMKKMSGFLILVEFLIVDPALTLLIAKIAISIEKSLYDFCMKTDCN